ncbi:MAG: hypothetical protein K0Q66_796 [Chitinophagaceae bacterium]|nr:hypothetical protein [Chitinophagaceae bacterium]
MKRPLRLLLVLPMVLFAILHYWVFNPDEKAYGLVHLMLKGLFVVFFLIAITTSYFSLFASLHRRQIKFEILLLTIFSVSLLTVIYTLTLRGHASGKTWLVAESSDSNTSQTLTLKENGNFTIS